MNQNNLLKKLKSQADVKNIEGMARFGIQTGNALGISIPKLRILAKEIDNNHSLALKLWSSNIREARILAALIEEPKKVTERQMEKWVIDFDSWDVCDQVCGNLFDKTPYAYKKAVAWSKRKEEFVKRAGFVLMACLSVHDKKADNSKFEKFFPHIKRGAADERNFVKKAVNWALRQIGKRNIKLNRKAVKTANEIRGMRSRTAQWMATNALKELQSTAVQQKLKNKR